MAHKNEVIKNLWLGNAVAASDVNFLREKHITLVVNCTKTLSFVDDHIRGIRIPVDDPGPGKTIRNPNINIMYRCLPLVSDIIYNEINKGGVVFVHCRAGIQRSACVVAAFLLTYLKESGKQISIERAKNIILEKRPVAFYEGENINFIEALEQYLYYHL